MVFYISGPKLLFETTEISTQQESNYIYNEVWDFDKNLTQPSSRQWESTVLYIHVLILKKVYFVVNLFPLLIFPNYNQIICVLFCFQVS